MITFNEWGQQVLGMLPTFELAATQNGLFLNAEAAERLIESGEYLTVLAMLQGVCEGLEAVPEAFAEHAHLCDILKLYPHEEAQ